MHTSPYVIPTYRAVTIVSPVLSRDDRGEMAHVLTVDTTLDGEVAVYYDLVGSSASHFAPTEARSPVFAGQDRA